MKLQPIDITQRALDGNLRAQRNERAVLAAVGRFGHLRLAELQRLAFNARSRASGYEMARRTVRRLLATGELLERTNALGGCAYVLTRKGATRVRAECDVQASDGYDIQGVTGPSYWHRTLATAYLAERAAAGDDAYGEYAISKGWAPLDRRMLIAHTGRLPDGLVAVSPDSRGLSAQVRVLDWVEVESAYKPDPELVRMLGTAWLLGAAIDGWILDRLVLVYDGNARHQVRIQKAALAAARQHPGMDNEAVLASVDLVSCTLAIPLTLRSFETHNLLQLLRQP